MQGALAAGLAASGNVRSADTPQEQEGAPKGPRSIGRGSFPQVDALAPSTPIPTAFASKPW